MEDLNRVAEYISLVNERAAIELVRRVFAAIEKLETFPRMGSYPLEFQDKTYRQIMEPPVRIFYRQAEDAILVVHIFRMEENITPEKMK